MSRVPIIAPITIPAICPADRLSSFGVIETIGVTEFSGSTIARAEILKPALAYFESAS